MKTQFTIVFFLILIVLSGCISKSGQAPRTDKSITAPREEIVESPDTYPTYTDRRLEPMEYCEQCESSEDCSPGQTCYDDCCLDFWCEDSDGGIDEGVEGTAHFCLQTMEGTYI